MKRKKFSFWMLVIFLAFFFLQQFLFSVFADSGAVQILSGNNQDLSGNIQKISWVNQVLSWANQMLSWASNDSQELESIIITGQSSQVIDTGASIQKFSESTPTVSPSITPNLVITEVYFDWNDERVEIMNQGTENFSGNLKIIGAKSSEIFLENMEISVGENIIIGDKKLMIENKEKIKKENLEMKIADTKAIHIQLDFSGTIIDTFSVSEDEVNIANTQGKTSFQRFSDTQEIVITSWNYVDNVLSGYIANPWTVYRSTDEWQDWWENWWESWWENWIWSNWTWSNWTWTTAEEIMPKLLISEVQSYEKSYIEITNLSQTEAFSWMLSISWNVHPNLAQNISLAPQQQYIFYTDPSIFQSLQQFSWTQHSFEIQHATWLTLDLVYSWTVVDSFFVHQDWIQHLSGDLTSFEKIGTWLEKENYISTFIGLNLDRRYNINPPYLWNPWKIFSTAENAKDITQAREENWWGNTWGDSWITTGENNEIPINCDDFWNKWLVKISEIFPWNSVYQPFIEIENLGDVKEDYDYIYLSGTALSGNVSYSTEDFHLNKNILLTNTDARYNEGLDALANPNFHLHNTWWITVYGVNYEYDDDWNVIGVEQDVLDVVYYSWFTKNKSLYYDAHDLSCWRIFDEALNFSPTFDDKLLGFFSVQSDPIVKTVYVGWWWGGCSVTKEEKFLNTSPENEPKIKIKTIKYYDEEHQKITLESKTNEDINLRNYRIQPLSTLKNYKIPITTFFANSENDFTENYQLPLQNSCVNLLEWTRVIDRYCRRRLTKIKSLEENILANEDNYEENNENDEENSDGNNARDTITPFQFTKIVYNPDGVDVGNEKLYFNHKISSVFSWKLLENFMLDIYKNNELYKSLKLNLKNITYQGSDFIQWDFQLPNTNPSQKDIVVNFVYTDLEWKTEVLARGKYNPYEEKNIFQAWWYPVSSVLDGDTFRIKYQGKTQSIRLLWIDTPESSIVRYGHAECLWKEAKTVLKNLINKKEVYITTDSQAQQKDVFWRWLAYVSLPWTKAKTVNERLLEWGFAKEFTYKDTVYSEQNSFQEIENQAKNEKKGIWWKICENYKDKVEEKNKKKKKEKEENEWEKEGNEWEKEEEKITFLGKIKIIDVVYDPEWSDLNNEKLRLLRKSDLGDTTETRELTRDFYLKINGRKKYFPQNYLLEKNKTSQFTANFQFPNSKATCIELYHKEDSMTESLQDTYCYNPSENLKNKEENKEENKEKKEDTEGIEKEDTIADDKRNYFSAKILSVLPNPKWADKENEQITFSLSWNIQEIQQLQQLQQWENSLFLVINDNKKTKLSREKKLGKQTISGNLGLTNKNTCIALYYDENFLDKFCYLNPKEGRVYGKNNTVLSKLDTEDLWIFQKSKLIRFAEKTCLMYQNQKISCIATPKMKKASSSWKSWKDWKNWKNEQTELLLYKKFVSKLKNKLQEKWYPLYSTELKSYFEVLKNAENLEDFEKKLRKTQSSLLDKVVEKIITNTTIQNVKTRYATSYQKYLQKLEEKYDEI